MLRFLILEDDPGLLPLVQQILETEFQGAEVHTATTRQEALALLNKSLSEGKLFDAAIIDCRIPVDTTSSAEIEYSVGEAFRDYSPDTILIHFTAYVDEPSIRSELIKKHLRFQNTRIFLQKQGLWPREMLLALHNAIEFRLERDLEAVGRGRATTGTAFTSERDRWGSSGDASATGGFSLVCARIEELWPVLSTEFHEKVSKALGAEQVNGRVHVGIAPDTTHAIDVSGELPPPAADENREL